jgi:hypothetical protein
MSFPESREKILVRAEIGYLSAREAAAGSPREEKQ